MNVEDVMNRTVQTIEPDASVQAAADKMSKHHIGSLIVVKGNRLVGIITERDILSKVVAQARDSTTTRVADVMTKKVIMVTPDTDIEDAAQIMLEKGIKKLPVVKGNQLIGIITATDVCTAQPKLIRSLSTLLAITKQRAMAG